MIYRLCRYDILHRSMIYFRGSENIIKGETVTIPSIHIK